MHSKFTLGAITVRQATDADTGQLSKLAEQSMSELMKEFLDPDQIAAAREYTGVDRTLIEDGTYFIALVDGKIAGSGGWSARRALFRGGAEPQGGDAFLNPQRDAARIRAMYTHPDFARRGIGRILLSISEASARLAGFSRTELIATQSGERLYRANGWRPLEQMTMETSAGHRIPVVRMAKQLVTSGTAAPAR